MRKLELQLAGVWTDIHDLFKPRKPLTGPSGRRTTPEEWRQVAQRVEERRARNTRLREHG